jgi:hypothetical protein
MIGSMTNDAVGEGGIADGVRSKEIWWGGDVRRSRIVQPASGATKMNPVTTRAIQRSIQRSGRASRRSRSVR